MSLLSDLLSKIKHLEPKRGVPPGLRNTVNSLKKKEFNKRRLLIYASFLVIPVLAGFFAVYMAETYLSKDPKYVLKQTTQVKEQEPSRALNGSAAHDQQMKSTESENQNQQKHSLLDKTVQYPKVIETEKIATSRPENKTDHGQTKQEEKKGIPETNLFKKAIENTKNIQAQKTSTPSENIIFAQKPDTSEKDLYLYMARDFEIRRDYPNAIASYQNVLKIEPKNFRVMNNIASIFIHLNSFEDAKIYALMALSHKSDYVPALINAGIIFAKLEMLEESENYFLRAITLEPNNRQAIFNIAILYEKKENYKKAKEYYLKLQRLGYIQGGVGLERLRDK